VAAAFRFAGLIARVLLGFLSGLSPFRAVIFTVPLPGDQEELE
jgi:hypothetical protein